MTDLTIAVGSSDSVLDLASLEDWLGESLDRAAIPIVRPTPVPGPGQMGGISDILMVTLGSGGVGASLAVALRAWLQTRVNEVTLRIKSAEDEIEVRSKSADDVKAIAQSLERLLAAGQKHPS